MLILSRDLALVALLASIFLIVKQFVPTPLINEKLNYNEFSTAIQPQLPSCRSQPFRSSDSCGTYRRTDFEDFQTTFGRCEWQNGEDKITTLQSTHWFDAVDARLQYCDADGWIMFKVGPFDTIGGYDWTTYNAWILKGAIPIYRRGLLAFSKAFMGNVNEYGEFLGYPPLHQHHFHVVPAGVFFWDELQNHADGQCHKDHGGVGCMLRRAPGGFAYFSEEPVGVSTEFNDVRPNGSLSLTSWVVVALRPVDSAQKVRQYGSGGVATHMIRVRPGPCLQNDIMCPRGCCILTNQPSYAWSAQQFDWRGKVSFEVLGHSHSSMTGDVLLFRGSQSQVFSNIGQISDQNRVTYGVKAVAMIQRNILTRQQQPNPAILLCTYERASRIEYIAGQAYYRRPRCVVTDSGVVSFVTVAFYEKKRDGLPAKFGIHTLWWPSQGELSDNVTLPCRPSTYPISHGLFYGDTVLKTIML